MKVGVLGTGDVGKVLGSGFISRGHDVMMGSRSPDSDKVRAWVDANGPRAAGGTFKDTAAFGDVVVLATLWTGTKAVIDQAGASTFAGKVVIDATNPLIFKPNAGPELELGHKDSGGEQVQRWLPDARVVKAFNIVGNAHMVDPDFPNGPPDMFICGNDPSAKQVVTDICRDFGWPTLDMGGIDGARLLEPLCILWVRYGFSTGSWNHAFKLLRR